MYVMSLKNLNNWKSRVNSKTTESDESSNENTSDIASEIELDEDNAEISEEYSGPQERDTLGNSLINIENIIEEVHDKEEDKHIKEISGEITAKLKCIKSDSVSWEDDSILLDKATDLVWKDSDGNLVDEEGVVTVAKKSLKLALKNSEN